MAGKLSRTAAITMPGTHSDSALTTADQRAG